MKKNILLIAMAGIIFSASNAFCTYTKEAITFGAGSPADNPTLVHQLSNTVYMDYSATAATGLYYTISSYHGSGTRTYSTTSVDSKIFYSNSTATAFITLPTSTASTSEDATWSAL
jgi:hypothetical protein